MKIYLVSLFSGVLVGVIYSLLHVRSPAPPVVALIGLLGILIGEQAIPLGAKLVVGTPIQAAWSQSKCGQHLFGQLPGQPTRLAGPKTKPEGLS